MHSFSPPFLFDLHSRKRSLYFDFYIRYLIQLVLFCPPYFSFLHLAWAPCCVLTFPFSHKILTVTSRRTLSWIVSLVWCDFNSYSVLCVFAVKICLTTFEKNKKQPSLFTKWNGFLAPASRCDQCDKQCWMNRSHLAWPTSKPVKNNRMISGHVLVCP